jgi:hypothetical protein
MVAVGVMAMVLASAVLAQAQQAQESTILFVPAQQIVGGGEVPPGGATVSCTGTPFVLFLGPPSGEPTSGGTCTFENFGPPGAEFVCDTPTTLFLRFVGGDIVPDIPLSAFECRVPPTPPPPPTPAPVPEDHQPHHQNHQPHTPPPPQSGTAPITQDAEQQSEAGEIDQSFEVS